MASRAKVGGAPAFVVVGQGLEWAIEELKQICPVPEEIRKLTTTVNMIKAVLKDAEEKQTGNDAVGYWLRELKQLLLDAEDLIDAFTTDAAVLSVGAHRRNKVRSMLDYIAYNIRTMSGSMQRQVLQINGRLDHLARQKDMLGLQIRTGEDSRPEWSRRRQTGSLLADGASVIGRDREEEVVIEMLLSSPPVSESSGNRSFSVLSIVGMGGMGKTTLAQLAFNNQKVKEHFELMMWVCVSNDFDPVTLTKDMIDAASASRGMYEQYQITNWDSMQRRLLHEVEGKAFLLVLDDVWEADQFKWEKLFGPLNFGKKGSKVLVTTRNRAVVENVQGRMDPAPVVLGGLSDTHIWSLFRRHGFNGVTDAHGTIPAEYLHLEATGRQIVERLRGSPLAARTVGSLLNTELHSEHWERVLGSELWTLPQGEDDILPALGLSYQYLDGDLKQCFAYCSLFPKDYAFDREEVVLLWEAQCFLRMGRGTRIMETTGSKWFDELLYRSIFERRVTYGRHFRSNQYVMHDLTHDLSEYVSIGDCARLEDQKPMEIPSTVRHISVCVTEFGRTKLNDLCRYEKLRTLLFLGRYLGQSVDLSTLALDVLLSKLKLLRVLGLSCCSIEEVPSSIGDLKQLRFLDLSVNLLENLPESLGNLYNLQVLKLGCCGGLRALPISLGNLYNLQVLELEGCHSLCRLPLTTSELINLRYLKAQCELVSGIDGLGKLTGLQELWVMGRKVWELGGMVMLRELRMSFLEEVRTREEALQARLHGMKHLQVLHLEWVGQRYPLYIRSKVEEEVLQALRPNDGIKELRISGYGGVKSPDWMEEASMWASLSLLRHVVLECCPNWEVLPPSLGELRLLEVLIIRSMSRLEEWVCPLRDSVQDRSSASSLFFPRLRELQILKCPMLKELPLLPLTLSTLHLQEVGLVCSPRLVKAASSPHSSSVSAALSSLHIKRCCNLASIKMLQNHHLTGLKEILVEDCPKLVGLPGRGFGHLVSLEKLIVHRCRKLTCLLLTSVEEEEEEEQEEGVAPSQHLPCSLKELQIWRCGDARRDDWLWWAGLQHLTSLAELSLCECPTVVVSFFLSLERSHHHHLAATLRRLDIRECKYDYLQPEHSTWTSSSLPPPTLANPPASASAGVILALTSLTYLSIWKSPNVLRKWGHGGLPASLKRLYISGAEHFDDGSLFTRLRGLTSLEKLVIDRDDNLDGDDECLRACMRCLVSLRELHFYSFERVRSLPDALSCPSSLQSLHLDHCPSIQSFPAAGLPSSLQELSIRSCPALTGGRKFERKSKWPEVSYIPKVVIDGKQLE